MDVSRGHQAGGALTRSTAVRTWCYCVEVISGHADHLVITVVSYEGSAVGYLNHVSHLSYKFCTSILPSCSSHAHAGHILTADLDGVYNVVVLMMSVE